MEQIFFSSVVIVKPNKIQIHVSDDHTKILALASAEIDDPELLANVYQVIQSPLEEVEYGLMGNERQINDVFARKLLDDIIKQEREKLTSLRKKAENKKGK